MHTRVQGSELTKHSEELGSEALAYAAVSVAGTKTKVW